MFSNVHGLWALGLEKMGPFPDFSMFWGLTEFFRLVLGGFWRPGEVKSYPMSTSKYRTKVIQAYVSETPPRGDVGAQAVRW